MGSEGESIDNNSSYSKPTSTYCLQPVLANWNPNQLTEILFCHEGLDNINNASILNATINYLIETKTFNAERFWWTPDVMALTMMFNLKFNFLLIFFFDLFLLFLSFYYFKVVFFYILYGFFFVPGILQYVGLVIVIFCLMCRCWYRKKKPS